MREERWEGGSNMSDARSSAAPGHLGACRADNPRLGGAAFDEAAGQAEGEYLGAA
jgi:hypothetical protein